MSPVFGEKEVIPDETALSKVLGSRYILWQEITQFIADRYGETHPEWKFYGKKYGWTLKTLLKKRNLFFLTAVPDSFGIAFVFGDRAVGAVLSSDLPDTIKDELKAARKYAEGRGIKIDVLSTVDVEVVKKLIDIKISH